MEFNSGFKGLNLYFCLKLLCNLLRSLISAVKNIHVDILHVIT